jgi:hypothetical protein
MIAAFRLAMLEVPIVRDLFGKRIQPNDFGWVVRFCRTIGHDGWFHAIPFKSVPNHWRNRDQTIILFAWEDLLNLTSARGPLPIIVEHQFDDSTDNRIVQSHYFMKMPTLDNSRIDNREIDLAKFLKPRIIPPEHVHNLPTLIVYLL